MLAWLLSIPLELRCAAVFLLGLAIGGQLNRGIYRLAWNPRAIGPWSKPLPTALPRHWSDRLPVLGWFGLKREASLHGGGYWVRPILIELATGAGLSLLYYWEVTGELIPSPLPPPLAIGMPSLQAMLHLRFISHAVLIGLMIVATFIDFDEKTIPDWITLPGTLAGLLVATLWPGSLPTVLAMGPAPAFAPVLEPMWLTAPHDWNPVLHGPNGLALGLFCFWGWCFAIQPKLWTLRRGIVKAFVYLWVSMIRIPYWWIAPLLSLLGAPLIVVVWNLGGFAWQGLLTGLVGMAFGGALVWAIRVIGSSAMGQEAMGFGDVTLMAMIGAFVGWQGTLVVFFMAPFAALGIALAQYLLTKRRDIAFGPYLCVGALYALLRWPEVWAQISALFYPWWFIPAISAVCLVMMWGMLKGLRALRGG